MRPFSWRGVSRVLDGAYWQSISQSFFFFFFSWLSRYTVKDSALWRRKTMLGPNRRHILYRHLSEDGMQLGVPEYRSNNLDYQVLLRFKIYNPCILHVRCCCPLNRVDASSPGKRDGYSRHSSTGWMFQSFMARRSRQTWDMSATFDNVLVQDIEEANVSSCIN